ncbi:hypothetical protein MNBD_ALPHA11-1114 [hydrothermal vent metagenome]|uniref:Uncharacterized protein n=1 Tax=hydrothermal vent metagenome TaxID=652676 RepID=A0A3B0U1Y6_9ZZZZ
MNMPPIITPPIRIGIKSPRIFLSIIYSINFLLALVETKGSDFEKISLI